MVMWWKKCGIMQRSKGAVLAAAWLLAVLMPCAGASAVAPRKIRAVDADNHNILFNKPGVVTLVIGTSEDSQDAAREAGVTVYPFQGRSDFQLIVAVDLHDSIATWAPSMARRSN
jgi:hypothetical protein